MADTEGDADTLREAADLLEEAGYRWHAENLREIADRLTPEKPAFPSEGSAPCLSDKPSGLVPDCRGFVSDPESSRTPREVEPL